MTDLLSNGKLAESTQSITSSLTPVTFTANTPTITVINGTAIQTIVLPNSTSMFNGQRFVISNRTTDDTIVQYQDLTVLVTLPTLTDTEIRLFDNTTPNGVWTSLFATGGGSLNLKDGGLETSVDTTDLSYTVESGSVNFHPFMHVRATDTLTVESGARLVTTDDTVDGTVIVQPGGVWKVL